MPSQADKRQLALESNAPSKILLAYAVFLVACGFLSFALANFASKARSGIIISGATALVVSLCAYLARVSASSVSRKIGIHVGLIIPLVLAGVFGWRAFLASGSPNKLYLVVILASMAAGSLLTIIALLKNKPPPAVKQQ